jgi:hypothetical protein
MPLDPMWQNWAEVDQSDNTYFRDEVRCFVEHVEPDSVPVDSQGRYDDVEAILYAAWAEYRWFAAQQVTPAEVDAWHDDAGLPAGYARQPVPGLPGIDRLVRAEVP